MATDRLRRRLRDVDSSGLADLTSNFCAIGTPLPSLNTHKKDANELKPIWQQEARDAQGRRRFHGAFTGGFSAGYFNTVGSKEGWTPSSFRSSRSDKKAGEQAQTNAAGRVEDYMDEEDLEDWKAAQQVSTASGFGQDNAMAGLRGEVQDPLASALFGDVNIRSEQGVGWRLLRRMGWKEGQGLGPRVDANKKARLLALISNGGASSSEVTLEDMKHLYAPPPTPVIRHEAQQGSRKGLGAETTQTLQQALAKNRGAASKAIDTTPSASAIIEDEVWPDGRPMPSNFRLGTEPLPSEPSFPPDPAPDEWQPDPTRVLKRYALDSTTRSNGPAPATSPAARGQLLGEAKIPGPPPSIAAFLSAKAQERLAASSSLPLPALPAQTRKPQYVEVPRLDVATAKQALQGFAPFGADPAKQERYLAYIKGQLDPGSEEAKQLPLPAELTAEQCRNELREFAKSASMFRPMSSAIASRFTTASAAVMEHETKATTATPGLRHPAPPASVSQPKEEGQSKEPERELTTAQKAAKMGNFGHLTRKVEPWAPERLLCKRFGIPEPANSRKRRAEEQDTSQSHNEVGRPDFDEPDPFYGSTSASRSKKQGIRVDQHWKRNKEQLMALAAGPTPLSLASASAPFAASNLEPAAEEEVVGMGEDERQGQDTLTYVKPSLEVYKAIFESDEAGSDQEEAIEKGDRRSKPKLQDLSSRSAVLFQSRAKRKDTHDETEKSRSAPKRKKDKSKSKSLLTFDLDEGEEESAPVTVGLTRRSKPDSEPDSKPELKPKNRMRASDLF